MRETHQLIVPHATPLTNFYARVSILKKFLLCFELNIAMERIVFGACVCEKKCQKHSVNNSINIRGGGPLSVRPKKWPQSKRKIGRRGGKSHGSFYYIRGKRNKAPLQRYGQMRKNIVSNRIYREGIILRSNEG